MSGASEAADDDRSEWVLGESECLLFEVNGALVSILPWSESDDAFLAYVQRPGELVETEVSNETVELLVAIDEGKCRSATLSPAWTLPADRIPDEPRFFSRSVLQEA